LSINRKELDRAFNPRCVAVVGDKRGNGYVWLRSLSTFTGKLYSVQIDPEELPGIESMGIPNYFSLLDIPEPVDYVLIAVPRGVAPRVLNDCIQKRVGGAALFTSGFAETNTEEGLRLEKVLVKMAKDANFNLIGPNCMGIFNPILGLRHDPDQYHGIAGPVGFISQSGTHAIFFSLVGAPNGIKISKSVSYGNGSVLDSTDYLEYLSQDKETKIIGMYIEGIKEGRRFFQSLMETARSKPVLVWKGGKGEEGYRAIACHTGSLASKPTIWEAVIRQCGAIKVDSLDEMVDCVKALLYLKAPLGGRVALVAQSGGQSVVIADAFTRVGLTAPKLSDRSYRQFASFFNIIGGSYLNPLDISWHAPSIEDSVRILDVLSADANTDSLVFELSLPFLSQIWQYYPSYIDTLVEALSEFKNRCSKPFLTVISAGQLEAEALDIRNKLIERGIPSFTNFERAAKALKRVTEYYAFHREGNH
jgi:acyl-CoA synthetase (NDP forming)